MNLVSAPPKIRKRVSLRRLIFWLILATVLLILCVNFYVYSFGQRFILADASRSPFATQNSAETASTTSQLTPVVLVLGASVYSDGTLSPMLEERAKTALVLYTNGLARKILVSGDNRMPSYNEVIPIRAYLLAQGVPAEDIFTDFAGLNTYDSMYRAKTIFGVQNVIVVTQSFHLYRALYSAREVGLNAYGVAAPIAGSYLGDNLREFFATVKTFFKVQTHAKSLFLGREIPIDGDGRESLR